MACSNNNKFFSSYKLLLTIASLLVYHTLLPGQYSFDNLPQRFSFNQAYIFKYNNSIIPEGDYGHEGEIMIYYNEKTNCWLFTDKCFEDEEDNVQWILGLPNGIYISALSDQFGQKELVSDTINFNNKISERLKEIGSFDDTHKNTGITKLFGKDAMGFPLYSASLHAVVNPKSRDVSEQFITNSKVLMSSIYFFNERKNNIRLPVKFPTDIPMGMMVLQDHTKTIEGELHFELKEVAVVNYKIDLDEFR